MVTVSETVQFTYPVAAEDEDGAKEKVLALLDACKVPSPLGMAQARTRGEVDAADVVESEPLPCSQVAKQSFSAEQRELLLGEGGAELSQGSTPREMSHAAKAVLKKSGSGKLTPSRRKRH